MVWDIGTWRPHGTDDPAATIAEGNLHADVFGHKLRGRLVLVRRGAADSNAWLLLHKHDKEAEAGWRPEDHPLSVLSGRSSDQVRADPDREWRSDLPAAEASVERRPRQVTDDELAALDDLGKSGTWEVFGRRLNVTNLDKAALPRNGRPPPEEQAGPAALHRAGGSDRGALPDRPGAQHAPLPRRRGPKGVLAQGASGPCARVGGPLGQPRRGPG